MKTRRILSTILALTMLLTLFSGEFASAAGMKIVTAGEELAYDPLAETASVAYEQHDAGYAVSLDRAADSVTMHVTAVPGSRGADKARLYVRTGVALKAGVAYRVSFALSSEKKLADYTVNFDGDTSAAYGKLDKRSVDAGGTDRVEYTVTPKAASGELVLRLLLGKTEVNTLRFSDLAVEEAPAEQSGANKLLVDKLNYAAPGAIRCAAEAGYSAEMSSTDTSATMTVTNVPKSGAEVWKLKLMVSTGLKPEPGKTYRFRATLNSSGSGSYEACYNEGEVEKGYDVLYNQSLKSGSQTIERMIYVPTDKEDPGELVVQFSLGLLSKGTKVTISKVTVEEASPSYSNALAKDFALSATYGESKIYEYDTVFQPESTVKSTDAVGWKNEAVVWKIDDRAGDPDTSVPGQVTLPITSTGDDGSWRAKLHIKMEDVLNIGATYRVSFKFTTQGVDYSADNSRKFEVKYGGTCNVGDWNNDALYATLDNLHLGADENTIVNYELNATTTALVVSLLVGNTGPNSGSVTVSDLTITQLTPATTTSYAAYEDLTYNVTSGGDDGEGVTVTSPSSSAVGSYTVTCTGNAGNEHFQRKLLFDMLRWLDGWAWYEVSYDIETSEAMEYAVGYNRATNERKWGKLPDERTEANEKKTVTTVIRTIDGPENLGLQLEIGKAAGGTEVTVSNIRVRKITDLNTLATGTPKPINGYSTAYRTVWAWAKPDAYTMDLSRTDSSATFTVQKRDIIRSSDYEDWRAKLTINTAFRPKTDKAYRVSFRINATKAQSSFCALYGKWDSEKLYDGKYEQSIRAGETKTIIYEFSGAPNTGNAELFVQLNLGKIDDAVGNTFTVSGLTIEEGHFEQVPRITSAKVVTATELSMQPGYRGTLSSASNSTALDILETPATGMEAWKHKLFIDTGVNVNEGEAYRVVFDTLAENDMDFEVCYNRGSTEKGFTAVYGLHAAAGKTKTVEKMVFAESSGKLIVQLSLGNVPAPNKVTVSNLRVERVKYSYSGKSALPAEISYQAGDVSYWAHADYDARFTNTADAVTAHITPPAKNPEPWKVKLFLDTGVALEGGKYYKVTTDVSAKKSQNYEICYNNGGVEFGYDSMGGLKVTGGKTERIEKLISVPAGKKDANNLMLQFNLGKTAIANEVTIGGVTVEEVTLAYADALGKDFSYEKSLSTWTDPKTSYKAAVDSTAEGATLHISDVPASGTGVWMVKLFVHTGAMLEAGKSYQVSADLLAAKAQDFETCFNNEETEKGFDAIYGQKLAAGVKTTVDKRISVPASMTDAGELVLQFSVGGAVANDITVSNVSVQELQYGGSDSASPVPDTVIALNQSAQAAGTLDVTREKLTYHMTKIAADAKDNAIQIAGAALRSNDLYTVAFTAKADKELTGTLALAPSGGKSAIISKPFTLTTTEQTYSFATAEALAEGGAYDIFWQFGSADNQKLGSADVELSGISVSVPAERLEVVRSVQKVTVNGKAVSPDIYNINGSNYFKLRDLAVLLNGTNGQFVVRYNPQTNGVSLTTDKAYTPIGGELTIGPDLAATCVRSPQDVTVNGKAVNLKVYNIGGSNFFRLRDLNELLGFDVDYEAKTNTVLIASPLTPERQEASYAYNVFFRPEIDGESQPYVGDTMPFYDNGTYYIYYLKEGGDSYNHSVYLTTTRDFVSYREYDDPVLSASRADVQDSWIGTGSVVKVDKNYYFFYTGFNASGSQEYHEKIMVAKGSSPTSFTKVGGWSITPPAELNQKNDFRDPQAYYDPATGTISLTVTASKDGTARILKYTLGKDLSNVKYDGVIFTDPTGAFYNLECSDTFRLGNKWYLTYSGQEDTLWYASADSRFGPYSAPKRMDGTIFYAAKHVENGKNSYMVGWTRRSASASSTDEVSGWGGNLAVQQLRQNADGSLSMIPADSIASAFSKSVASSATSATLTAGSGSGYSYKKAFTSSESFKLTGEFTCAGTGSLGLAFDFDGTEDQYKLISVDPAEGKLKLLFNGGATQIAETQAKVAANQKHTFTYIQDGSVGIFYLDGQAALTVRLYGVTDKPIYLFAENNSVTFTSLRQFTR